MPDTKQASDQSEMIEFESSGDQEPKNEAQFDGPACKVDVAETAIELDMVKDAAGKDLQVTVTPAALKPIHKLRTQQGPEIEVALEAAVRQDQFTARVTPKKPGEGELTVEYEYGAMPAVDKKVTYKVKAVPVVAIDDPKIVVVKKDYIPSVKRLPVTLTVVGEVSGGSAELTCSEPAVEIFEQAEGGQPLPFPVKLSIKELNSSVERFIQGKAPSASAEKTELILTLKDVQEPHVPEGKDTLTSIELGCEVYEAKAENPAKIDGAKKLEPGLSLDFPQEKEKSIRAKLVLQQAKPADYAGVIELRSVGGRAQLFDRPDGANRTLAKTDVPNDQLGKGKEVWLEGTGVSGAPKDGSIHIGLEAAPEAIGERVDVTVRPCPTIKVADPRYALVRKKDDEEHKPQRLEVELGVTGPFKGTGRLRSDKGANITLYKKQDEQTFTPASMPLEVTTEELESGLKVYVEATKASEAMDDIELVHELVGGEVPGGAPASDKITAVELKLEVFTQNEEAGKPPTAVEDGKRLDPGAELDLAPQGQDPIKTKVVVHPPVPKEFKAELTLDQRGKGLKLSTTSDGEVPTPAALQAEQIPQDGKSYEIEGGAVSAKPMAEGLCIGSEMGDGDRVSVTVRPMPTIELADPRLLLVRKTGQTVGRVKVELGVTGNFDGTAELKCDPAGQVKAYEAEQGDEGEKTLPLTIEKDKLNNKMTLWLEGAKVSTGVDKTKLVLTLNGGTVKGGGPAEQPLTCVELTLDVHDTEGAPLEPAKKADPGRDFDLAVKPEESKRAKLIVKKVAPEDFTGDVELKSRSGALKLYASDDAKTDRQAVQLPLCFKPSEIGEGKEYWAEAAEAGAEPKGDGFTLGVKDGPVGDTVCASVRCLPVIELVDPKVVQVPSDKIEEGWKRTAVKLSATGDYNGTGKLEWTSGQVKVFAVEKDGQALTSPHTIATGDLKTGKTLYLEGAAKAPESELKLSLEGGKKPAADTATEKAKVIEPKLVIPHIDCEYQAVLCDRELDQKQPGSDAKKHKVSPTLIEVYLEETEPGIKYEGTATLEMSTPAVDLFKDKECTQSHTLTQGKLKLERADITGGKKQKIYLRGKTAGDLKLTLKPDAITEQNVPEPGTVMLKEKEEQDLIVVKLELEVNADKKDHSKVLMDESAPTRTPMSDDDKVKKGRFLMVQDAEKAHARAKIVVKKPDAKLWTVGKPDYEVVLDKEATTGAVKLFDAESAGAEKALPLKLKQADLGADLVLWAEGTTAGDTLRHLRLHLGLDRAPGGPVAKEVKVNGDWATLTVVELEKVTPDTDDYKQYINLPVDNTKPTQGRKIKSEAKLTKALENVEVMYTLVAKPAEGNHQGNKDKNDLLQALRVQEPKDTDSAVKTDNTGKATSNELELSRYGGDIFNVVAYLKDAPPLSKKVPKKSKSKDIAVWRKVFFEFDCMNRGSGGSYSDVVDCNTMSAEFKKGFVEVERKGVDQAPPHQRILTVTRNAMEQSLCAAAPGEYNTWTNPLRNLSGADAKTYFHMAIVDTIGFNPSVAEVPFVMDKVRKDVQPPGPLELDLRRWYDTRNDKVKVTIKKTGQAPVTQFLNNPGSLACVETGDQAYTITVDLRGQLGLPNADDLPPDVEILAITIPFIRWTGLSGLQSSMGSTLIGMRWRERGLNGNALQNSVLNTMLHESGHAMSLASFYKPDGTPANNWYQSNGDHCDTGGNSCIMFHANTQNVTFCDVCNVALRARDLSNMPKNGQVAMG